MTKLAPGNGAGVSSERTDTILRVVLVILIAAVLGLAGLFGYSVWQARNEEQTATPAQRALGEYRDFVRKNPNSAPARVRYGEALVTAGLLPDATEQLKAAVKLDPKHTGAWLDLGIIAMQTNQRKAAENYFNKVLDLTAGADYESINQRRETALFHLGEIALDAKRYEDAAGYFKAAIRIRRDAADSYFMLAQAFRGMDDDNAALKQLDISLAFDPNRAQAHYLYGKILYERKDLINAAVHLRRAYELAPDQEEARIAFEELGSAQDAIKKSVDELKSGNQAEALDSALLARQIDPKNVDAVLQHARVLIARGDKTAAKKVLGEALKLEPANEEAKKMLASLGG